VNFIQLETIDYVQGISTIIFILICLILGSIIILKYFITKNKGILYAGFSIISLPLPWLSHVTSFLMLLILNIDLNAEIQISIAVLTVPIPLYFWSFTLSNLLEIRKILRNFGLVIASIAIFIFDIFFFYFLFNNPKFLGIKYSPCYIEYSPFIQIYFCSAILILIISGIIFLNFTIKADNRESKLRGFFFSIAFFSLALGSILDTAIHLGSIPILVWIVRIILVSSAIEFYIGFILPEWAQKLFLKE